MTKFIENFSFGESDRFAHQAKTQLIAATASGDCLCGQTTGFVGTNWLAGRIGLTKRTAFRSESAGIKFLVSSIVAGWLQGRCENG